MANKHMERCSILLVIKKIQIKTTIRNHYNPLEQIFLKKQRPYKAGVSILFLNKDPRYFMLHQPYALCQNCSNSIVTV